MFAFMNGKEKYQSKRITFYRLCLSLYCCLRKYHQLMPNAFPNVPLSRGRFEIIPLPKRIIIIWQKIKKGLA